MNSSKATKNFEDDGRTIAEMNVEGLPWYKPHKKNTTSSEPLYLTRAEKRAMLWGIMSELVPMVLLIAVVFTLVFLALDLIWLR